jgi:hypothetical protein
VPAVWKTGIPANRQSYVGKVEVETVTVKVALFPRPTT